MTAHNCCSNYTRSQLMRAAAAEAGKGLPVIENGMPVPAGTGLSRRSFLSRSAGLALAVYGAAQAAARRLRGGHRPRRRQTDRILVSLFFDGGIDALSRAGADRATPSYAAPAPDAGPRAQRGHRLQRGPIDCAGTPRRPRLATLHGEGKVSTFPAIGYTSPNQSHFTSRHFYEIGELEVGGRTGWLGPLHRPRRAPTTTRSRAFRSTATCRRSLATATKPVAAVDSDITDYDM